MKILFSNAPWHRVKEVNNCPEGWLGIRAGSRWPHTMEYKGGELISSSYLPFPFFLATGGALAKKQGLNVKVRDSIALGETYEHYYDYLNNYKPDILVLETSTPSLENDLKIAQRIKEDLKQIIIIFTGIHFELEDTSFISNQKSIDYVVYGEYEGHLNELLLHLCDKENSKSIKEISSIVHKTDGIAQKNTLGELVDINKLPWPEQDDLPYQNYFDAVCGLDRPQLQILTTRGCPYGCIFCVWPQLVYKSNAYRSRDPKDVVDEIEANLKKHSYKSFYIDDDTFNVNRKHVLEIAQELIDRKLNHIPWGAMCRADLMDEEILLKLKKAGLYSVKYGVESGNQEILDQIDKRMDLKKTINVIKRTKELGIKVHLTFTFGLPDDTRETIEESIELSCDLPNDSVQFSIATPFPGTKMYEMYEKKGWITSKNWAHYNGSAQAVSRTDRFSGEQLQEFIGVAYKKSAEARIIRAIKTKGFKKRFDKKIKQTLKKNDKIIIFQCAIFNITREILHLLINSGHDVHLMLHCRFLPEFEDLLPVEKLHVFNNSTNFNYFHLKDYVEELNNKNFSGVIIPYSNPTGGGYEEVERLAKIIECKNIIRITSEGEFL